MLKMLIRPPRFPRIALMSQCAVCRSWPSSQVCSACVTRFASAHRRCRLCAISLPADLSLGNSSATDCCIECIRQSPPVDATHASFTYAYPWSALIARYKFGDQPRWAAFFAGLMLQSSALQDELAALSAQDVIVPLPLSAQRLQTRGFNQAWELAAELSRLSLSPARTEANLLLRVRHTQAQTELKRDARLVNVKGAFQVDPLRVQMLKGRKVMLVDDVMTSGASIYTAATALRAAGAAHITAVVLARTPAP